MSEIPEKLTATAKLGKAIVDFYNSLKEYNMRWEEKNVKRTGKLNRKRKIQELKTEEKILELKEDIKMNIKIRKMRNEKKVQRYERFLISIEKIVDKIEEAYPELPEPMVLIIQEYASDLLNNMWEAKDDSPLKVEYNGNFLHFLELLSEDTLVLNKNNKIPLIPEKTINYIKGNKSKN